MLSSIQKLVLASSLLLSVSVCLAQKETILSGTISGLDSGSKVYLSQTAKAGRIDSFSVTSDSFQFKLSMEQGDLYFLGFTANTQRLGQFAYLQKGSNVHINSGKHSQHTTFSGSKLADEQNDFIQGLYPIYEQEVLLDKELIKAQQDDLINKLKQAKEDIKKQRQNYYEHWVKEHKDSPFSVVVLYMYMKETPVVVLEALYNSLSPKAKENNLVTRIIPYYFAEQKNKEQFKTGERLTNFVLNDTSGKAQSFYRLRGGNYVLLDFWASWCAPCRKSTPEISRLLATYRQNNFKVIGISADTDRKKWKEAIVKDQMRWYHLSDLKGTDSGFMQEKQVYSFPTYVLVSPDGTTILKAGNIERVKEELAKIFGKASKQTN